MGWNPANWAITDTLQGQEGGYSIPSLAKTAATFVPGVNTYVRVGDGVTDVLGASTSTASAPSGGTFGAGIPFYNYGTGAAQPTGQANEGGTAPGSINTSGTGTSAPAYDPKDLDYLNSQESLYSQLLSRVDPTLNTGLQGITDQYQKGVNNANTQYGRAQSDFDQKEYTTKTGMQSTMGGAKANSRTLADSVRRILGLAGAAGGTAMSDATQAIGMDMQGKENAILGDYNLNLGQLKRGREETETDYNSLLGDLGEQRTSNERSLRGDVAAKKQSLQQILDEIKARRASLVGGDYKGAIQSGIDNFLGYEDQINALPNQYKNVIKGRDVKVAPVSLKDYFVDKTGIQRNQTSQGGNPYAEMLLRRNQEEEQQPLTY